MLPSSYTVSKDLAPGPTGSRKLVLNAARHSSHVLYELSLPAHVHAERFAEIVSSLGQVSGSHMLGIVESGFFEHRPWVLTDYPGDADGLLSLAAFLDRKGGCLTLEESKRCMEQLLVVSSRAHSKMVVHGPFELEHVLVEPRGSLAVELYGLLTMASVPNLGAGARAELIDQELRSILAIGYQLLTGLTPEQPRVPVQHMISGIHSTWLDMFETGLNGVGFSSADHALSAVRGCRVSGDLALGGVRTLLRSLLKPAR